MSVFVPALFIPLSIPSASLPILIFLFYVHKEKSLEDAGCLLWSLNGQIFPGLQNSVSGMFLVYGFCLGGADEWGASGAEESVPFVLAGESMALVVSALVDPALSQSFMAFKAQCAVFL